jgi:hypothetical protein
LEKKDFEVNRISSTAATSDRKERLLVAAWQLYAQLKTKNYGLRRTKN